MAKLLSASDYAAFEKQRAEAGMCKCCVGRTMSLSCMSDSEAQRIMEDLGLTGGGAQA